MREAKNRNKAVIWLCLIAFMGFGALTLLLEHLENRYSTSDQPLTLISSNIISLDEAISTVKYQIKFSKLAEERKIFWDKKLSSEEFNKTQATESIEEFLLSLPACYHSLKTLQRKKSYRSKISSSAAKQLKSLIQNTITKIDNGELTKKDTKRLLAPLYSILNNKNEGCQKLTKKLNEELLKSLTILNKKKSLNGSKRSQRDMALELDKALLRIQAN